MVPRSKTRSIGGNSSLFLSMSLHKYFAEFIGTLIFTFLVWISVAGGGVFATPIVAALTLGLLVYLLGGVSGAHLNPAITLGLLSVNKIKLRDAAYYIACQLLGAMVAMMLGTTLYGKTVFVGHVDTPMVFIAEALGAFMLSFGVNSVVLKKVPSDIAGIAIGTSLLLGVMVAAPLSNGILNPAIALGIGSFSVMYVLGPIVGAIVGAYVASLLNGEKIRFNS